MTFFTSQTGGISISLPWLCLHIPLFMAGHGFPRGTIPENSITVGGVTTTHGAIRVNATGQFGVGAGNHIQVLADANVPLGNAEVRADGMVFSYSNGNIRLDATHWRGATTPRPTITPDSEQSHSVPPPVLPAPGRYSASTFVTNTDGVATSTTKVLSVTI